MLPGWAIAVTEPRSEARAAASVRKLGYQVFYPKVIRRVRLRGLRTQILCPLFPGYFFAWVEARWIDLLAASGIAGVLMEGDELATVRTTTMQELKDRCNKNGIFQDPVRSEFQVGQRVKASSGVFADKVGIFDGTAGQHHAALFDLFGARTRVLFKEGTLVAV